MDVCLKAIQNFKTQKNKKGSDLMIQFINVSKAYKEHNVIENINLEINKGELVVLIGPSGCGNTTILKMIIRLI